MSILEKAIEAISAQQGKERTAVWMVGEQLKDMLRLEPENAELVAHDLEMKSMSLTECEKKINAFADKQKTGNFACVVPAEAEKIIREFYGLPEREKRPEAPAKGGADIIDLGAFF